MKLKELNAKILITLIKPDLIELLNRLKLNDMIKLVGNDRHSFFQVLDFLESACNEKVALEFGLEFFEWKLGEVYQNNATLFCAELEFSAKDTLLASAASSLEKLTKFLSDEISKGK